MSDYLQLDEYMAALDEAIRLIALGPQPASPEDERLDVLLHRIAEFPPVYIGVAGKLVGSDSEALLAQLRADVEAFVRKRAQRSAVSTYGVREHGVGRAL